MDNQTLIDNIFKYIEMDEESEALWVKIDSKLDKEDNPMSIEEACLSFLFLMLLPWSISRKE